MFPFLLIAGLIVLWQACRTFESRYVQKFGALAFIAASFCVGYFLGDRSIAWGVVTASIWFVLPWVEIVTRVRKLRLPLNHEPRRRLPPSRESFPDLPELSRIIEGEGFEQVEDMGWEWQGVRQFVRVFYNEKDRTQASICMNEQEEIAFAYLSVSSRTPSGKTFVTWDYPFSYTMKFAPDQQVQRVPSGTPFSGLLTQHLDTLRDSSAELTVQNPAEMMEQIQGETRAQVNHNLAKGLIRDAGEGTFRYSWRGCIFLWFQLLKDMIRV